jgi:hypothetical protein
VTAHQLLDAGALLDRIADRIPADLRDNVVVIGSIATAWAFRDLSGTATVATKDIDLLLRPAIQATSTAESIAAQLLSLGWRPVYTGDRSPGTPKTPDHELPALRLAPPGEDAGWFVELLGTPQAGQQDRRVWQRFDTHLGAFGLPCFRFMPVAVDGAAPAACGLRVAEPARMALAHLLEHAEPDDTPIASLSGNPPRFLKDVGRAVSLWWLASEQSSTADDAWLQQWRDTIEKLYPDQQAPQQQAAMQGLNTIRHDLRGAHDLAVRSVLAPHGTPYEAWLRAHDGLIDLTKRL